MVKFEKFILNNGLTVIVHRDQSTPIAAVNILYKVGARDENPDKTGFAHLFEHLMFGGSVNIPKYDTPLEEAGGENNAFTNNDITNYYLTIPAHNLELALWLESDRMLNLAFSEKSLAVQKNVVAEEFKQVYLNQPYGDAWSLLRPMAYKIHPYRWPTIGADISHIEKAEMPDVKTFYKKFYNPDNAILVVSGNVEIEKVRRITEKWFGQILPGNNFNRDLPMEPPQTEARKKTVERDVPFDALYKTFHMCKRTDPEYYTTDLISDILSNGDSSRLYTRLVKEKRIFSEIDAFISGDLDNGLFIFTGKPVRGISLDIAEINLQKEIDLVKEEMVNEYELQKVKNKVESLFEFSQMNALNKAMNLAYYELTGDANLLNEETQKYNSVTRENVREISNEIFSNSNSSTLFYHSINN
ncbi:MAG: insulinase family protein [Bacteroidales bacterium]|nr:insulinase family protein [Bacteroidales bacterium]